MFNIAHIHPMLVHFPLALLPTAMTVQLLALFKGQRLCERKCLPKVGLALLALAAVTAAIAAVFGDIALDAAVSSGIPMASLETHEELGQLSALILATMAIFAIWFYRRQNSNLRASWIMWLTGLIVLITVLTTAWFGGQLVYELGVNVAPH